MKWEIPPSRKTKKKKAILTKKSFSKEPAWIITRKRGFKMKPKLEERKYRGTSAVVCEELSRYLAKTGDGRETPVRRLQKAQEERSKPSFQSGSARTHNEVTKDATHECASSIFQGKGIREE